MQKTLVTGAAGFLGQALVAHLKLRGHKIYVLGHGVTDCFGFDGEIKILGEEVDLKNLQRLDCAIDSVYHFAGTSSVPVAQNDPAADLAKSLVSTQILVSYLEHAAPNAVLIYSSSAAVYGNPHGGRPLPEETDLRPISVYGETKQACEKVIGQSKLGSIIVRFFSIYGAGLRKQLFWDACNKFQRSDYHFFGAANAYRDWIHIHDAIQLLDLLSLQHTTGEKQIFNGANGHQVSVGEALKLLCQTLGMDGEPIFDRGSKVGDPLGQCGDISKISALGYRPAISLEHGLKDYGEWFLRNKIEPL